MYIACLCNITTFITYLILVLLSSFSYIAVEVINETNKPNNEETFFKMKKLRLSGDAKKAPKVPVFLRRH